MLTVSTYSTAATTKPPSAGVYTTNKLVQDTEGSDCVNSSDENLLGAMDFGGLAGKTSTLRSLINQYAPSVETEVFKTTSGSGSTSQSGKYSVTIRGAGNADQTGTFSYVITEIDQFSFTMSVKELYGNCEEDSYIALTKIGDKL